MPWQEQSTMSLRREFVSLAQQEGTSMAELCRRYGISRKTGYKWVARHQASGPAGLADQSRRPAHSPARTPAAMERLILAARTAHPAWGGRKLHHFLLQQGHAEVPAPSTITAILARHGRLNPEATTPHHWQRFEHPAPNDLWQMDFHGHRALEDGQRVHPLPILDDHSRFLLALEARPDERQEGVQTVLTACFQRYGLPRVLLCDTGPPWGASGRGGITALEAWLLRLGIDPWHGEFYHPQTQGKVERLHRTVAAEVFAYRTMPDLASCQTHFATFRQTYNHERPHAGIGHVVPASRYQPSPRRFPDRLPAIEYGPDDSVRLVRDQGAISFHNRSFFISRGLIGLPVAVRPTTTDGQFAVVFCHRQVATIDLTASPEV